MCGTQLLPMLIIASIITQITSTLVPGWPRMSNAHGVRFAASAMPSLHPSTTQSVALLPWRVPWSRASLTRPTRTRTHPAPDLLIYVFTYLYRACWHMPVAAPPPTCSRVSGTDRYCTYSGETPRDGGCMRHATNRHRHACAMLQRSGPKCSNPKHASWSASQQRQKGRASRARFGSGPTECFGSGPTCTTPSSHPAAAAVTTRMPPTRE